MDEVPNEMVVEEITTPETSPQENTPPQETQVEDRQDKNWREMRRINTELERKARAQEELIASLIKQAMPVQQGQREIPDELDSIPDGDYIPKGQVQKLMEKEARKADKRAEETVQRILEEREKANFHKRLKEEFSDFDDVVTAETLEMLEQQHPKLAKTIADLKDPYAMGYQTYEFIKAKGLVDKTPNHRRAKEVEKKIEQNAKTVQSPQAFDKRPMAQTFQMTEKQKQDLWKEMNSFAQMADGVPKL